MKGPADAGFKVQDKPVHIYYFGDHDPSGVHIPIKTEAELRIMAP